MKLPTMKIASALGLLSAVTLPAFGQYSALLVPKLIQYQGRVATGTGGAWAGTEGYFVFALLVGQPGAETVLWNNWVGTGNPANLGTAYTSPMSNQVVTLPVNSGVFSIRLGDGASTQQIPATVFFDTTGNSVRSGVKLAVWFSPDDITFTRLSPDVEFTSVPFAMVAGIAETVQERAVTPAMLADGAVTNAKLSAGSVTNAKIADGSVTNTKIADGTLVAANMAASLQADSLIPAGSVMPFAGTVPPLSGWVLCDGSLHSRTDPVYARLNDVIGITYGGNAATFRLPDMKGRVPVGAGLGDLLTNRVLSTKLGEESHPLILSEMPRHNHGGSTGGLNNQAGAPDPGRNYSGSGTLYGMSYVGSQGYTPNLFSAHTHGIAPDGGDSNGVTVPHNVMQPSIVLNYIIKL